jgi:hypothetical protein
VPQCDQDRRGAEAPNGDVLGVGFEPPPHRIPAAEGRADDSVSGTARVPAPVRTSRATDHCAGEATERGAAASAEAEQVDDGVWSGTIHLRPSPNSLNHDPELAPGTAHLSATRPALSVGPAKHALTLLSTGVLG